MGPGVWGLGCGAWGAGPGVQGLGCRAWGAGRGVQGLGCRAWGAGRGVQGLGCRAWGAGPGVRGLGRGAWGAGPGARGLGRRAWGAGPGVQGLGRGGERSFRGSSSSMTLNVLYENLYDLVTPELISFYVFQALEAQRTILPDTSVEFELYDRIINVREGYSVPLGLRGTVTGLHPGTYFPKHTTFFLTPLKLDENSFTIPCNVLDV